MDKLTLLSQDKATLLELKNYLNSTLERKLISKALKKEDVSGFAEASEIIKVAMNEIDNLFKDAKKVAHLNPSE